MKGRKRGESAEYALTEAQVKAVLAACQDIDERVTIGCQLFLGLRVGELAHMRADWITDDGNLKVPGFQSCNCAECVRMHGGTWKPKTKAGARTLPIPKRLRRDLAEMFKIKPYGMEVSRVGLYYRTKVILQRARVRHKGLACNTAFPQALRATCARMLANGGMNPINLGYYTGQNSITVMEHLLQAKQGAIEQGHVIFG